MTSVAAPNPNTGQRGKSGFRELMQAGQMAYTAGKRQLAHDIWREAAMLDPYNEQVWIALLEVLETDEDREVCLHNILAINPANVQARHQLNVYQARAQQLALRRERQRVRELQEEVNVKKQRGALFRRAMLMGVLLGISGIVFAVVISILMYIR
jgi:hypothetical protein